MRLKSTYLAVHIRCNDSMADAWGVGLQGAAGAAPVCVCEWVVYFLLITRTS